MEIFNYIESIAFGCNEEGELFLGFANENGGPLPESNVPVVFREKLKSIGEIWKDVYGRMYKNIPVAPTFVCLLDQDCQAEICLFSQLSVKDGVDVSELTDTEEKRNHLELEMQEYLNEVIAVFAEEVFQYLGGEMHQMAKPELVELIHKPIFKIAI